MDCEALRMVCSPQFWRMAILWAISLLHSYLLVILRGRAAATPGRRRPRPGAGRRPICVVTGVIHPPSLMRVSSPPLPVSSSA